MPTSTLPSSIARRGRAWRGLTRGAFVLCCAVPALAAAAAPDPARLTAILRAAAPGKTRVFAHIVELDSGREVLAIDAATKATPASVAKLFATAAAIRTIPGEERLVTRVLARGRQGKRVPVLALVGGGDPSLRALDLARLADAVRDAGIDHVQELRIDHTLFDDALPSGFDEKDTSAAYRAPVDALMVDGGVVAFTVAPGATAGAPVTVSAAPSSPAVRVVNQAQTVAGKAMKLSMFTRAAGKETEFVVQGSLGLSRGAVGSGRMRVADAGYFAGELFRRQLADRGVVVAKVRYAAAEGDGEQIARHESAPLDALVATCNKTSHNQYAEVLFRLAASRVGPTPVTNALAQAGVRRALDGLGLDWAEAHLANGSGLYHANRVAARQVTTLLRSMARDERAGRFRSSLAIAGLDGTLRGRMGGSATRGKVHAKTGTLDDVIGLAGYAEGEGQRYAFALFYNGPGGMAGPWRRAHDRLLQELLAPGSVRLDVSRGAAPRAGRPPARHRPAQRPASARRGGGRR